MKFIYALSEPLNLTKFRTEYATHIGKMNEITYIIHHPGYDFYIDIVTVYDSSKYLISCHIWDAITDSVIFPSLDEPYKYMEGIASYFRGDHYKAHWEFFDSKPLIEHLCNLIKLFSRVYNLRAFL